MQLHHVILASIKTGTVAALAMMPFGAAFRAAGLRVGHYGPKFASLFVSDPGPVFLFTQHIVLGWISALPLVAWLLLQRPSVSPVALGALYGAAYYGAVNALALPLYFGDKLPWTLGVATVLPSLVIHVVFGAVIGYMCRQRQPADGAGYGHDTRGRRHEP